MIIIIIMFCGNERHSTQKAAKLAAELVLGYVFICDRLVWQLKMHKIK